MKGFDPLQMLTSLYIQYLTGVSTPSQFCKYVIIPFHATTLKKLHFATM